MPPGHSDVDGFIDVEHEGQTYRELWLDRVNADCGHVLSDCGIVRDAARCETRYGAYGAAGTCAFAPQARPVRWLSGPLAAASVQVSFGLRRGPPTITVVGGGAAEDPDRTNHRTLPPT